MCELAAMTFGSHYFPAEQQYDKYLRGLNLYLIGDLDLMLTMAVHWRREMNRVEGYQSARLLRYKINQYSKSKGLDDGND